MMEQPAPAPCPRCGGPITRLLWGYLSDRDLREVEAGRAILGGPRRIGAVAGICLGCEPRWAAVHRLAWQDFEWQGAKERSIEVQDFDQAVRFLHRQDEIRAPLRELVEKLVGGPAE